MIHHPELEHSEHLTLRTRRLFPERDLNANANPNLNSNPKSSPSYYLEPPELTAAIAMMDRRHPSISTVVMQNSPFLPETSSQRVQQRRVADRSRRAVTATVPLPPLLLVNF